MLPEGSPGIIQKYRFDSGTSGKLVIDSGKERRRESAVSPVVRNEGWRRELGAGGIERGGPIKNAPAAEESTLWRLRPDKGGKKLVRWSRRRATKPMNKWVVAATFVIQVGECREEKLVRTGFLYN